jgi:hypothetical protein
LIGGRSLLAVRLLVFSSALINDAQTERVSARLRPVSLAFHFPFDFILFPFASLRPGAFAISFSSANVGDLRSGVSAGSETRAEQVLPKRRSDGQEWPSSEFVSWLPFFSFFLKELLDVSVSGNYCTT